MEYIVENIEENMRLDKYLAEKFNDKSRTYLQNIISSGNVKINDKNKKSNYKLKENDVITVNIPEPIDLEVRPEEIPLDILYEDKDIIVVNKEKGMVVHPAPGNYTGTLVNALLNHCKDLSGINGVVRPGIVHRIDKDTSGILVVAKNDNSHNKLSEQLKDHSMNRVYIALVEGTLKDDEGKVDLPLGRDPKKRIKMAVVKNGKNAVTHYKVIKRYRNNTLVECRLETGRTHQIRVHMAYIGHPLVGDPVYGYKKQRFNLQGQLLHAKKLGFIHPSTNKYIEFESDIDGEFTRVLNILSKEII